jgi:hypothetical protein
MLSCLVTRPAVLGRGVKRGQQEKDMPNIAVVLKEEIVRLARKEIRQQTGVLKKMDNKDSRASHYEGEDAMNRHPFFSRKTPGKYRLHTQMLLAVGVFIGLMGFNAGPVAAEDIRDRLPGRCVKVATIAIGRTGNRDPNQHEKKLRLALEHLETAGQQGVDIACLPEEFAGTTPETIPGPTTTSVAALEKI